MGEGWALVLQTFQEADYLYKGQPATLQYLFHTGASINYRALLSPILFLELEANVGESLDCTPVAFF